MRPKHLQHSPDQLAALTAEHRHTLEQRAGTATHSVLRLYTHRVMGIPGTLIGASQHPETRTRTQRLKTWNYWWQAHLLDAIVDAGHRAHRAGDPTTASTYISTGRALVRGIQARNYGSYPNDYYDDMAWLTLALERLNRLITLTEGSGDSALHAAANDLYPRLTRACTPHLGGGAFWSTAHDFKNTPATAPIALALARAHHYQQASDLLNWLDATLYDPAHSLYLDGIRITGGTTRKPQTTLEKALYTYNQGPILGAYLALLDAGHAQALNHDPIDRITQLIAATDRHFGRDFPISNTENLRILATSGTGDGGLFTGILVRYLAEAALHPALDPNTRERARSLVLNTADIFWEGRREFDPDLPMNELGIDPNEIRGQAVALFSPNIEQHISDAVKPGTPLDLSTQVQAWMVLEAAAKIA